MFKEAGHRSPRTQLTKIQIAISVQGRRTEARVTPAPERGVLDVRLTSLPSERSRASQPHNILLAAKRGF